MIKLLTSQNGKNQSIVVVGRKTVWTLCLYVFPYKIFKVSWGSCKKHQKQYKGKNIFETIFVYLLITKLARLFNLSPNHCKVFLLPLNLRQFFPFTMILIKPPLYFWGILMNNYNFSTKLFIILELVTWRQG